MTSTKRNHSSLVNVLVVVAGSGVYVVLGFIALLIVANLLTPAEFGYFSLSMAALILLQETCGTGFDLAVVKVASSHGIQSDQRGFEVLNTAIWLKLAVLTAIAALLLLLSKQISLLISGGTELSSGLKIVSIGVITGGMLTLLLSSLQVRERFFRYTFYRVLLNVSKVSMLGLAYVLGMKLIPEQAVLVWAASFAVVLLLTYIEHSRASSSAVSRINWFGAKEVATLGGWLVASHLLFALYARIDVFLLARFWQPEDVGTYAIAWNLAFTMDMVTFSLIMTLLPKASRMKSRLEFQQYAIESVKFSLILSLPFFVAYWMSDWFFSTFFSQYIGASTIFKILFIGALTTLFVHPMYLILYSRDKPQLMVMANFTLLLVMLAAGLALVPGYGVHGAAWASSIARLVGCCVILGFVFNTLKNVETHQ